MILPLIPVWMIETGAAFLAILASTVGIEWWMAERHGEQWRKDAMTHRSLASAGLTERIAMQRELVSAQAAYDDLEVEMAHAKTDRDRLAKIVDDLFVVRARELDERVAAEAHLAEVTAKLTAAERLHQSAVDAQDVLAGTLSDIRRELSGAQNGEALAMSRVDRLSSELASVKRLPPRDAKGHFTTRKAA